MPRIIASSQQAERGKALTLFTVASLVLSLEVVSIPKNLDLYPYTHQEVHQSHMADLEGVEQVDFEVDEIAPGSAEPDDSRRKIPADSSNVLFVSRLIILFTQPSLLI